MNSSSTTTKSLPLPLPHLRFVEDLSIEQVVSNISAKPYFPKPLTCIQNVKDKIIRANLEVVDLANVANLLNATPKLLDEDETFFGFKILRFGLYEKEGFRFGREGAPAQRNTIPAHCQLGPTNECLAAGNIVFNDENKVVGISNKSGNFRPPYLTLQLVFKQLLEQEQLTLADSILLEITTDDKRYPLCSIQKKDVKERLAILFPPILAKRVSEETGRTTPSPTFFDSNKRRKETASVTSQVSTETAKLTP